MLSEQLKTSIYAHLNTPIPGQSDTAYQLGLVAYDDTVPFYTQPSALYERVLNLRPSEESYLTGQAISDLIFTGTPQVGGSVTASALRSDTNQSAEIGAYDTQPADLLTVEPLFAIATGLALAINSSNTPYTATIGPHEIGAPLGASQAALSVTCLVPGIAFTMTLAVNGLGGYVASQGTLPIVSRTFNDSDTPTTVFGLVPLLDYLLAAISGGNDFAPFLAADVIKFDPSEIRKRMQLYRFYQLQLAKFFFGANGITYLSGGRRGSGAVA